MCFKMIIVYYFIPKNQLKKGSPLLGERRMAIFGTCRPPLYKRDILNLHGRWPPLYQREGNVFYLAAATLKKGHSNFFLVSAAIISKR